MKTFITALVCICSCAVLNAAEQPNIIVFIADDVSWNDFGCYGSPSARTPVIDRLAENGLRFNNAFLTASSCSPSRCSIITGRYPHNNGRGAELHGSMPWHLVKFPGLLRKAGYYTALSGKNHMPQDKPPAGQVAPPEAWDHVDGGRQKGNSGGHANWLKLTKDRPKDRPFFFWFAAYDAHRGWDADKQWQAKNYGPKHGVDQPDVPPFLVDDAATRADLASYRNEVTRFDHFIGQVVEELQSQNEFKNTLIFVLADNGRPFPRAKTRLHDSGMKTALVAHWPQGISQTGSCDSLVSVIDIAPTVLTAANCQIPATVQGTVMQPIFRDKTATVRDYAFSEHNWHDYEAYGRSVRTRQFLYLINKRPQTSWQGPADSVRSPSHQSLLAVRKNGQLSPAQADVFLAPRPEVELYDRLADPHQLHNLVDKNAHRAERDKLHAVLQRWQSETGDSVPDKLTPDSFHRTTGERLGKKNRPAEQGNFPGFDRDSVHNNHPGPRLRAER